MASDYLLRLKGRDETGRAFKSVQGSLKSTGRVLGAFKLQLLGVLGVAGLGAFAKGIIDSGDEVQKLSIRLGASTEALSEYKYAAQIAGVEFNVLSKALQYSTRSISEAASGIGEAKDALKELGVDARTLNQLEPDQRLEALGDALSKVTNEADRVRLAERIFGARGVGVLQLFEDGAAGLRQLREEAQRLGLSINRETADTFAEINDSITRMKSALRGLGTQILAELAEPMRAAADAISEWLLKRREMGGGASEEKSQLDLLFGLGGIDAVERYGDQVATTINQLYDRLKKAREDDFTIPFIMPGGTVKEFFKSEEVKDLERQINELNGVLDEIRDFRKKIEAQSGGEDPIGGDGGEAVDGQTEALKKYNAQVRFGADLLKMLKDPMDEVKKQQADLDLLYLAGAVNLAEYLELQARIRGEYEETTDVLTDLGEESKNTFNDIEQEGIRAGQALADAFADYILGIKEDFIDLGNLARSIFSQFLSIGIKSAIGAAAGAIFDRGQAPVTIQNTFAIQATDASSFNNRLMQADSQRIITGAVQSAFTRIGRKGIAR